MLDFLLATWSLILAIDFVAMCTVVGLLMAYLFLGLWGGDR